MLLARHANKSGMKMGIGLMAPIKIPLHTFLEEGYLGALFPRLKATGNLFHSPLAQRFSSSSPTHVSQAM